MKVIADAYIPFLKGLLDDVAQVEYLSPAEFTAEAVRDADALIIRTRAKCNKELLSGSKVRFIATATIGYDHIDTKYCEENGVVVAEWSENIVGALDEETIFIDIMRSKNENL